MTMSDVLPIPAELMVEEEPFTDEAVDALVAPTGEGGALEYREGDPVDRAARWSVTDRGSAQWAMAKVAEYDAELQELRDQALEWAARIQAWFDKSAKPLAARRDFFEGHLGRYALALRAEDEKHNKTLRLPSGEVATRRDPPRAVFDDKDAVVEWAKAAHPDIVKYDVGVSDLRSVTRLVEQPSVVELTLVCGCIHRVAPWPRGEELPLVGSIVVCEDDGDQLLGRVNVTASYLEVVDEKGDIVPGTGVDPEELTYKVKPIRP